MTRFASLALGAFMTLATALPAAAADTYAIDTEGRHYYAGFQISHLGFSIMHGRFDELAGAIEYDPANPTASSVSVTIKANSLNTNMAARDAHLKSPDFFNVEEFPEITFVSTELEATGKDSGRITGDLTMLGVTRPVTLEARLIKAGPSPMTKAATAAWSARGTLKRSDFGMKYGVPAIGDEVTLLIDFEALKK